MPDGNRPADLDDFLDAEIQRGVDKFRAGLRKPRGVHLPEKDKPRGQPEAQIQRAIVGDCRRHLQNGKVAASVATAQGSGDAEQRARYGAKLKSFGVWAGEPDLRIYLDGGVTVMLEVKAQKGRLSDTQQVAHLELQSFGHWVYVVRSVDEARAALIRHGARFLGALRCAVPVQPLSGMR
jgi:hypothetical protein